METAEAYEGCHYQWITNGHIRFRGQNSRRLFRFIGKELVTRGTLPEFAIRLAPTFNDICYKRR